MFSYGNSYACMEKYPYLIPVISLYIEQCLPPTLVPSVVEVDDIVVT